MKNIIIFDLDGTLADIKHRVHYVLRPNKDKDWDSFHKACVNDMPIVPIMELLDSFQAMGYEIIIFSGRSDIVKKETLEWLEHWGVMFNRLKMRKHGDFTPDDELKKRWLKDMNKDDILFVVDDRDRVVKMWRDEGLTCLQCAEGKF